MDLSGLDLTESNLEGAQLQGANLARSDLRKANLYGANLAGANLAGANLRVRSTTRSPSLRRPGPALSPSPTFLRHAVSPQGAIVENAVLDRVEGEFLR